MNFEARSASNTLAKTSLFPSLRLRILGIGIAVGLLAVACGAESNNAVSSSSNQESTASEVSIQGKEEFGLTMQALVQKSEEVEELIASCMSDAGFEYIAADFDTIRRGMVADKSLPGLSEEEYIAQYGFGITTFYTGHGPQAADVDAPSKIGLGEQNVRIFKSLPAADQVAYNRTLLGEHPEGTLAVSLEAEDFSRTGGCTRTAIDQVFTSEQLTSTYKHPLDVLIEQDPRMIAALEEYADCVGDEGFDYSHPDDVVNGFSTNLDEITGGAPIESLSAEARAALAELQSQEVAVAAVAFECEEDLLDPVADKIASEFSAGIQR